MTQHQLPSGVVREPPSEGGGGVAAATASNILSHPSLVKETMILNGHVSSAPRPQHAALEASRVEGPSCSSATETSQPQASGLPSHHRHAPQAGQHPAKSGPDLLPAIPAPNMRLVRAASLPVHTSHGSNEALFTTAAYPGAGVAAPATATATAASLRRAPSEISFSHIDGSPSASTAVANSGTRGPVMAVTCGDESSPMSSSSESSLEASAAAAPGALASASAQVQVPLPAPHPTQASGDATGAESDLAGAEAPSMLIGAATGVDGTGNQVVQRKGRFTLLKPAAQAAPAAGSCSAAPELSQASTGDSAPAAVLQATTAQMPPLEDDNGQAAMQPPPSTTEPANITKRKGRFTLTQETSAPLTIVVDRAPAPPPPAVNHPHQPPSHPDRERGSSVASAAMSSISASITAAAEQGSIGPPPVAPEPPPAEAPAATTAVATATSPSLASNSSVRTVKKMGRFVVSSVSGFDPQSTASVAAATAAPPAAPQPDDVAPGPPPSAPQEPGHYPPSVISDSGGPAHAGSSAVPQPQSGGRGIPREVLTIVDPGLAGPSEAPVAPPAAQAVPQPLHPPSLPPPSQPVLYALVPANVHLPSQPVIGGGSAHSAGPTHSQDRTAFAPPGQADHVGSASIRPVLSSGNLAAADGAAVRQDAYVQANPAISARLPAHESEAVPVPPAVNDAPRPKEMLPATASQPPPPSSGATARNGGYTGRQGVGKMFHYLDQLRLEATDAERTIKNLQTDVRLLKEKNKELEATARDTERKLIEERKLREAAEYKLKQAKKKLRDLTHAASHSMEDHARSAATSYDSLGIAASLSGEYRDERMTIDPPNEAIAASVPPVSPPFSRKPELAYTPTRDFGTSMMGDGTCPIHTSPTAAAFVANMNLSAQHVVDPGRQSASNSPRPTHQGRVVSNTSKLPPLPSTGAAPAGIGNGGSARTPNDRPPLGSSTNTKEHPYPNQNGSLPPNRSLAMEFDPMRGGNRERLPSGDSMSDLPEMTSVPVAHAAFPNAVHPVSPTHRQASKTYHGVRDLHQQFHLQQPALDPTAPTLSASSSFSDFKHMVLVPQQLETMHGGSPIVFAFPSSFAQNGNQQWIPVAMHDPSMLAGRVDPPYQGSTAFPAPSPDPFDEIVRRSSNAG